MAEKRYVKIEGELVTQVIEYVERSSTWDAFYQQLRTNTEPVGSPALPLGTLAWAQGQDSQAVLIGIAPHQRKLTWVNPDTRRQRKCLVNLPWLWLGVNRAFNPADGTLGGVRGMCLGSASFEDTAQELSLRQPILPNTYPDYPFTLCSGDMRVQAPLDAPWGQYVYGEGGVLATLWASAWNVDLSAYLVQFNEHNGFHLFDSSSDKDAGQYWLPPVLDQPISRVVMDLLKVRK